MNFDFIIIGGGIVGLSTAWQLQRTYPGKTILLLEKEGDLATHQTGHNSGVIHAGVYYAPDSLKARLCREGLRATVRFCREHGIAWDQCGKLIVATSRDEEKRLKDLGLRCHQNGIEIHWVDRAELAEREPEITGVSAFLVKDTGIADFPGIARRMGELFVADGGEIRYDEEVRDLHENSDNVTVETDKETFRCNYLVACAGLMADRVAESIGIETDFQIIPFRGEYYKLAESRSKLVNHLIYPVPNPDLPFLGVHITRMIDGSITVGPNAVLGWKREGYGRINIDLKDSGRMLGFPGFWKVVGANLGPGLSEFMNSWYKPGYLKRVNKYCPSLKMKDLKPWPAGVRAQAVMKDGSLVHDFLFAETPRSLHVCNAPSPAATSAIPIGDYICGEIASRIG
jgi:L-2-hydroxyglutarate oxidase